MNQLKISQNNISFQAKEVNKTLRMTNVPLSQTQRRPIMYKIKTNKIQFVDAKPSCGYISGRQGHNQIVVNIRALKNQQFSAKLQILFISHELITEQIVQKNKTHFDIDQYNQFHETIKKQSSSEVKTIIVNVNKKAEVSSPLNLTKTQTLQSPRQQYSNIHVPPNQSVIQTSKSRDQLSIKNSQVKGQSPVDKKESPYVRLIKFVIVFILGLLVGYAIAKLQKNTNINEKWDGLDGENSIYDDIIQQEKQIKLKKTDSNQQGLSQNKQEKQSEKQKNGQKDSKITDNQQILPASPSNQQPHKFDEGQFRVYQKKQKTDKQQTKQQDLQYDSDTDTFTSNQTQFQPLKYDEQI